MFGFMGRHAELIAGQSGQLRHPLCPQSVCKRWTSSLSNALIIGVALTAILTWAASASKADNSLVPVALATRTAQQFIKSCSAASIGGFPQWKGAVTGKPVTYYDLADSPTAYCFAVVKSQSVLGYLMIGARSNQAPVQEYSCDPPPHCRLEGYAASRVRAILGSDSADKPKLYYPAAAVYLAMFHVVGRRHNVEAVLVDVRSVTKLDGSILGLKRSELVTNEQLQPPFVHKTFSRLVTTAARMPAEKPAFRFITNVPDYAIQTGRAEAGATFKLLGYWGVLNADEITSGHLSSALSVAEPASGIAGSEALTVCIARQFVARHYSAKVESLSKVAVHAGRQATSADYMTEIDQGRPFILTTSPDGAATDQLPKPAYNELHATLVGVGYLHDTRGGYIIARDPVLPEAESLPRPLGSPGWARPGIIFCNWAASGNLELTTVKDVTKADQHQEQ